MSSRSRNFGIKILSFIYLVVGFSWLLGPALDHRLLLGPNLVSEYEAIGMPHAVLFRLLDAVSAAALIGAVFLARKLLVKRLGVRVYYAAGAIGVLSIIDVITSPQCRILSRVCDPSISPILVIHYIESLLLGLIIFTLGIVMWRRDKKWWWGPAAQVTLGAAGLIAASVFERGLFGLQVLTILIQTFWLWKLFFAGFFSDKTLPDATFVRRGLGLLLGLVGLLSVIGANNSHIGLGNFGPSILFGPPTAWLIQHNIVVGFALMYLARKIYQGDVVAYKISLWLMVLQVIKYSAVLPRVFPLVIYSSILILLVFSSDYFVRHSSRERFLSRLKSVVFALIISAVTIALLSSLFRLREPDVWERSAFSASRIVMRVSLLEVSSDKDDPLRARLFGQALTAAGIAVYAWILTGLFLPSLYAIAHTQEAEREQMQELLERFGTNSEDSFKLWPADKRYWFNANGSAGIAYKQYKGFVFALESPVGNAHSRSHAVLAFQSYCRQHGWKLVWLLVADASLAMYENAGMRTLKIGASAVVNLQEYADSTSTNKWWRWVRNKNSKLGLSYEQLRAPYSVETLKQVGDISHQWLQTDERVERTFALGHYDEKFLDKCVLHVLQNDQGNIVAFANQLPNYHNNTQATIDLMRANPEYDGAVAYLLSEALRALRAEGYYKTFDLGFVPLAQKEEAATKKAALAVTKTLIKTFFSASGLRQFKNKFEPEWHDNYLAWDGDWLDLPAIAQALDKILTPEES